ncbi:MAG: DUF1499 domain-containing protein [Pacificimonas sp.]
MINDVTTDRDDPPRFTLTSNGPADFDSAILPEHEKKHGDVQPVVIDMALDLAFDRALKAAKAEGWRIVETARGQGAIEAVATTKLLRFKDDIAIRLRPEGGGTRIDVRSKSRVGRDDFGANAKRIKAFLERVSAS